jgi:hypothetical protein
MTGEACVSETSVKYNVLLSATLMKTFTVPELRTRIAAHIQIWSK